MIAALAFFKSIPGWVWGVLAVLVISSGLYLKGRADGKQACQDAQEAAQARYQDKAARVAKGAQEKAQEVTQDVREKTDEAADEAREIASSMPRTCPPQSGRLQELGREAVKRARASLPAAPNG